jgi:peptide/nickel transport system substrate-binding protein
VIGAGYGRAISQMAVPGDDSYDEALEHVYPYDPDKAKARLRAAGYGDGLTLPLLTLSIVQMDKVAEAAAGQLARVGVNLKLDIKSNVPDFFTKMTSQDFGAVSIGFGHLPASINYSLLWGPNASLFNPFRTTDPQLDALNEQMSAAPADQVPEIARRIQALIVRDAWFVPIVASPLVVLHRPEVTGVTATPQRGVVNTAEFRPAG